MTKAREIVDTALGPEMSNMLMKDVQAWAAKEAAEAGVTFKEIIDASGNRVEDVKKAGSLEAYEDQRARMQHWRL